MPQYKIAVVARQPSARFLQPQARHRRRQLAPPTFLFHHPRSGTAALTTRDDDANQAASVKRLKAEISAPGPAVRHPEYNRSMPACWKNAIDHARGLMAINVRRQAGGHPRRASSALIGMPLCSSTCARASPI